MKVRTLGLLAAVTAAAAVPVAADAETPRDKATGGGKVLLDPANPPTNGAADTLAFTAQRDRGATDASGLADGQVQVNRRSGEAGTQVKFHGVVECLMVVGSDGGGKAYINGYRKGAARTPENYFELYVVDGGSGEAERSGDQAMVWFGAEETEQNEPDQMVVGNFTPLQEDELCGIEEDPKNEVGIAGGNYQVRDYTAPSSMSARQSKSTSLTALR